MKHLGDITKINGAEAPTVEVIIGGSPCQDLSVAGKRAGLSGERSGLFMEQLRIIKEMRENDRAAGRADDAIRPRFMVWENVPGAFSSNKGEDFRTVLEETARVADSSAVIPRPPKGKWSTAGAIMGDGWSLAWRVLDAQFWGVPQRRRRIALVADFGGECAPPILFECESVQGDIEQSAETGQGAAADTETGASQAISFQERAGCDGGVRESLSSTTGQERSQPSTTNVCYALEGEIANTLDASYYKGCGERQGEERTVVYGISAYESNAMKSGNPHSGIYEAETARTLDGNGGSPACNQGGVAVVQSMGFRWRNGARSGSVGCAKEQAPTLGTDGNAAVYDARGNGGGDTAPTLTGDHQNRVTDYTAILAYSLQGSMIGRAEKNGPQGDGVNKDRSFTLNSTDRHAVTDAAIVRRLTPLECERLQGYPTGWTDIGDWTDSRGKTRKCTDSARYKALGNSIALPPWTYVLTRLNAYCKEHTMASLFDGIGGFPLIWTRLGGACLWASEIEEFPIAVTKIRFG
jgi:DNA (cytosine-5)-methyltransferase 1